MSPVLNQAPGATVAAPREPDIIEVPRISTSPISLPELPECSSEAMIRSSIPGIGLPRTACCRTDSVTGSHSSSASRPVPGSGALTAQVASANP